MRSVAVAGIAATVVVAVLVAGGLVVLGGSPASTGSDGTPGTSVTAMEPDAVVVDARLGAAGQHTSAPVLDGLPPAAVLHLRVSGFEPSAKGTAQQCRGGVADRVCGNPLTVQFDDRGVASFQYLVHDDLGRLDAAGDGCSLDDAPCVVTVTSLDGRRRVELDTVFGDRLPPRGLMVVEPDAGLQDGETVTVVLTGLPSGRHVTVTTCIVHSAPAARRCGSPAPTATVVIGDDGSARTTLAVTRGPVGAARRACEHGPGCAVAALADRADVRVDPVPIAFGALPGAEYDPTRLALGLGLAAVLVGLAAGIVRRTDWAAVGEAAAPEIDDAEYADLDAIVAALPDEFATTGVRD